MRAPIHPFTVARLRQISVRGTLVSAILILAFGTAYGGPKDGFEGVGATLAKYGLRSTPEAEDYPGFDAVIVFQSNHTEMWFPKKELRIEETVHRMKKLFRNVDENSSEEIHLYPGERISSIRARTITAEGRPYELSKSDFLVQRGTQEGETFHSDRRIVRFTFPMVEPGALLEYEYTLRKDEAFLFDRWAVQDYLPILESRYVFTLPAWLMDEPSIDFNWRYWKHNCAFVGTPTKKRAGEGTKETITFTWSVQDVAPLVIEPLMPPVEEVMAFVQFAPHTWTNWDHLTGWYWESCMQPQLAGAGAIPRLVKDVTADAVSRADILESIRTYVESIRYVAIELGEGGIIPSTPDEVMARQYGDCKDKSTLLVSMLREAGFEASPALVGVRRVAPVPDFPAFTFDHMIVAVEQGDETLWIDPTAQFLPLGQLPSACEDTYAVIVGPDGRSRMARTPARGLGANQIRHAIQVEVSATAPPAFRIRTSLDGEFEPPRRALGSGEEEDVLAYCHGLVSDEFAEVEMLDAKVEQLADIDAPLELEFAFRAPGAIRRQGEFWMLSGIPFSVPFELSDLPAGERVQPLDFGTTVRVTRSVDIDVVDGELRIRSVPDPVEIGAGSSIDYRSAYALRGDTGLRASQEFAIRSRSCPKDDYALLRRSPVGWRAERTRASKPEQRQ
ncbi:MAG: DUF3857 domain-containing protein [Candidatus Eisenbacteria bacterium]